MRDCSLWGCFVSPGRHPLSKTALETSPFFSSVVVCRPGLSDFPWFTAIGAFLPKVNARTELMASEALVRAKTKAFR